MWALQTFGAGPKRSALLSLIAQEASWDLKQRILALPLRALLCAGHMVSGDNPIVDA